MLTTGRRRSEPMRVRLDDVAAAAGVSIVTVSRSMNMPDIVAEKTRRRIEQAMHDVGYVPDLVARGMAQQRTGLVAAFVPTLTEINFAGTVQGLSDELARAGLHLLIGNTQYSIVEEEALLAKILGRRPDALILTGTVHTPRARRLIAQAGIPVVEIWNLISRPIDRVVGFSNTDAMRRMTRHLIEKGHRRIGYVGRPVADNDRATARRRGFLQAMRTAGLDPPPAHLIETETRMTSGAQAVETLVRQAGVDAIVFSGDNPAVGAMLACGAQGIRVPQDVALTGFGDYEVARLVPGGLTTVRIDSYAIGARAAASLLNELAGKPKRDTRIDVGFELMFRGSG